MCQKVGERVFMDAALNLTKLMTYDSQNRIQNVENASAPLSAGAATHEVMGEYRYDDQGFRVYKKHASTGSAQAPKTIYELETPNKYFAVERQKDLANNPVPNTEYAVNNVFLDGVRIAAVVPTGQARWFMTDHGSTALTARVDSVNIVTNDEAHGCALVARGMDAESATNGDAISAIDYLPYGETWYQEGDTGFSPKYNSQELDKESGLYFFNARHYDPEIARFETADSVVDGEFSVKGWNRYMYVGGNPIMYKDPTGHCVECDPMKPGIMDRVVGGILGLFSGGVGDQSKNLVEQGVRTRSVQSGEDRVGGYGKVAEIDGVKFFFKTNTVASRSENTDRKINDVNPELWSGLTKAAHKSGVREVYIWSVNYDSNSHATGEAVDIVGIAADTPGVSVFSNQRGNLRTEPSMIRDFTDSFLAESGTGVKTPWQMRGNTEFSNRNMRVGAFAGKNVMVTDEWHSVAGDALSFLRDYGIDVRPVTGDLIHSGHGHFQRNRDR